MRTVIGLMVAVLVAGCELPSGEPTPPDGMNAAEFPLQLHMEWSWHWKETKDETVEWTAKVSALAKRVALDKTFAQYRFEQDGDADGGLTSASVTAHRTLVSGVSDQVTCNAELDSVNFAQIQATLFAATGAYKFAGNAGATAYGVEHCVNSGGDHVNEKAGMNFNMLIPVDKLDCPNDGQPIAIQGDSDNFTVTTQQECSGKLVTVTVTGKQ